MSRQRREIFSEINITPLTDIFLVLLIIMMVIAPMLDTHGLKLAVPTIGASKSVTTDPKVLNLRITREGQFFVEDRPIQAQALQGVLFKAKGLYPDGLVIQAAPQALYGSTVKAMDAARASGIEKIAVTQTEG